MEVGDTRDRILHLTCKSEVSFACHFSGVYAPNCYVERRKAWKEMRDVRGPVEGPWAVCGDFNTTRHIREKEC